MVDSMQTGPHCTCFLSTSGLGVRIWGYLYIYIYIYNMLFSIGLRQDFPKKNENPSEKNTEHENATGIIYGVCFYCW